MATTTAPPPVGRIDHQDLRRFLNALRRQLWWREALAIAAVSAILGVAVGIAAVVFSVGAPWMAYTSSLVLWLTLAGVAIGVVAAGLRRPALVRAARVADRQLRTASRLATAAEVLEGRLSGRLAPAQLDDTWRLARGIRPLDAYPQGWPRVRMAVLGVLVSLTVVALSLVGALAPLEVAGLFGGGDQSAAQTADMDAAQAADAAAADAQALAADQSSNPAASAQTLEELQSQAEQSQAAQAALQKLGDALRATSAARDVGDALRAGNYDDAAAKVETLAQQSDQLSRISKRELANALERAAIDSSRLDPPLAVAEDRVARALNRLVYSETKSSLDNLASAINDAKKGVISQEALAQQLDQLQQQQQDGQKPTAGGGGDIGESEQGYIPDIPGEQPKQVGLVQGLSSTISVPGPEGDPTKAKNSSVGQEAGGDPLGDLTSRLEAPPVDVSVSTQLANDQGRNRANPQAPTVKISDTSQNGVRSSDVVQPGDPVQDVAEQMVEPTESRQAVRAFFKSTSDTASNPAP